VDMAPSNPNAAPTLGELLQAREEGLRRPKQDVAAAAARQLAEDQRRLAEAVHIPLQLLGVVGSYGGFVCGGQWNAAAAAVEPDLAELVAASADPDAALEEVAGAAISAARDLCIQVGLIVSGYSDNLAPWAFSWRGHACEAVRSRITGVYLLNVLPVEVMAEQRTAAQEGTVDP